MTIFLGIFALIMLLVAVIAGHRLLRMTDAEIKRELNKDVPVEMIDRLNKQKRRRTKRP